MAAVTGLRDLSEVRTRPGYDVLDPFPASNSGIAHGAHFWCILFHMGINHCERCGGDWCYRGTGRPIRCGKYKSPYLDRPRKEAEGSKKL